MKHLIWWIIPGNPGRASYYNGFCNLVRERAREVVVFDHARDPEGRVNMAEYAREQTRRFQDYLSHSQRTSNDVEVVLIGHSVGAYVAQDIVGRQLFRVDHLVLLFPFVARPSLRAHVSLLAWAQAGHLVMLALRLLPDTWLSRALRRAGAGPHTAQLVSEIRSGDVASYLELAQAERREILTREGAHTLLQDFCPEMKARTSVATVVGDRWNPRGTWSLAKGQIYELPPWVAHAFVLQPRSWKLLADFIESTLDPQRARAPRVRGESLSVR